MTTSLEYISVITRDQLIPYVGQIILVNYRESVKTKQIPSGTMHCLTNVHLATHKFRGEHVNSFNIGRINHLWVDLGTLELPKGAFTAKVVSYKRKDGSESIGLSCDLQGSERLEQNIRYFLAVFCFSIHNKDKRGLFQMRQVMQDYINSMDEMEFALLVAGIKDSQLIQKAIHLIQTIHDLELAVEYESARSKKRKSKASKRKSKSKGFATA